MGELCRLCALHKSHLVGIYEEEGHRLCIESKIKKCLNIKVGEKETLPKTVCIECCTKLDAFDEFLDSSLNAQNTLTLLFSQEKLELGKIEDVEPLTLDDVGDNTEDFYSNPEDPLLSDDLLQKEEASEMEDVTASAEVENLPDPDNLEDPLPPQEKPKSCSRTKRHGSEKDALKKLSDLDSSLWFCSECSEVFKSVEELSFHHTEEHKQEVRFLCSFCSKQILDFRAFLTHIKRHRKTSKYKCDECGRSFSNKKVLESHHSIHSDVRPFACQECGKAFRQQSALDVHSRCHLPADIKNKFQCDQCNKRFSTKPNLVTHKRIHTGVRNYTCDQCGKSFIQKGNLDAHLLTHSVDKPFTCNLCHKKFKTGMQLKKHQSVHTGDKPHQCDVCGRTFREKGTLREHHRIHTGAMPFTCEYCGKCFRFKGILTTHRRQHTGERPYSCLECQHHFTNWPNYNKHMKRRHGINTSRTTRSMKIEETPQQPIESVPINYETISPQTDIFSTIQAQAISPQFSGSYMSQYVYSLSQIEAASTSGIDIAQRY